MMAENGRFEGIEFIHLQVILIALVFFTVTLLFLFVM